MLRAACCVPIAVSPADDGGASRCTVGVAQPVWAHVFDNANIERKSSDVSLHSRHMHNKNENGKNATYAKNR